MTIIPLSTCRHVFGPVPSRRLGRSLGVDLVPHKTCTLNCVYCECGKTTRLTLKQKEYVPTERVQEELSAFLSQGPVLDHITFSGAGEPTLHSGIGRIIRFLKAEYPKYPVALLTNGTLLYESAVRDRVLEADLVIASLDAVSEAGFQDINRPHPALDVFRVVEGLISFRKTFQGSFWLEIFLVPGMNDRDAELVRIKQALEAIGPDRVQLNTLDRPGAETWVRPVDEQSLAGISEYLCWADILRCVDLRPAAPIGPEDYSKRLLSIIRRRPCTAEDISRMLGIGESDVHKYLDVFIKNGEIECRNMSRGVFYRLRS